jgi:hypothetical protein
VPWIQPAAFLLAAQMLFLAGITAAVLGLGWWLHGGDPAWGRLVAFPEPAAGL